VSGKCPGISVETALRAVKEIARANKARTSDKYTVKDELGDSGRGKKELTEAEEETKGRRRRSSLIVKRCRRSA